MKSAKEPNMRGFVRRKVLIHGIEADENVPISLLKELKETKDGRLIFP